MDKVLKREEVYLCEIKVLTDSMERVPYFEEYLLI